MEHPQIQFQLERWTGREYVPHGAPHVTTNPHTASSYAETARMLGLPSWRMVRTDKARPAKVRNRRKNWGYNREPCSLGKVEQVRAYLQWARDKGLSAVTFYSDAAWTYAVHPNQKPPVIGSGSGWHPKSVPLDYESLPFKARFVDPDEILGPVYPDLELAEAA